MDENERNENLNEELEEDENKNNEPEDKGAGSDDKSSGGKSSHKPGKSDRTFTQDQVKRMMTREKNQGRSAAYKEFGIDPKDERMVSMFKAFVESQKTDDQKEKEKIAEAESKQKEAESKQKEAEQKVLVAEAKAEAVMLGVKPQYVEDAVTIAMSRLTDDTDLKTIMNELKDRYSLWFDQDDDEDGGKDKKQGKTGQKGTGKSIKDTGGKKTESTSGLGARLAAQRKSSVKTSYWGK